MFIFKTCIDKVKLKLYIKGNTCSGKVVRNNISVSGMQFSLIQTFPFSSGITGVTTSPTIL